MARTRNSRSLLGHMGLSIAVLMAAALLALPQVASLAAGAAPTKKTERTWKANCSSCHGDTGKGDTEQGKKMGVLDFTMPDWQKGITDEKMKETILAGLKRTKDGKDQEMKPFKDKLKPEEIDALIGMIRWFPTK